LLLIAENTSSGAWALFTIGGGAATPTILFQSSTLYVASSSPAAGKVGVQFDGTALFRVYNNSGGAKNFSGATVICRPAN
jgi:hypothetical protein